ncbi:hypothetical protein [Mucilaginibacter ginkgonis]|uniref:Lipocalin-like protein n=1 Tax=Mucilaginibacter ginkgonis TaxID=2682091 RepID=A0A6I4HUM8_9SPHI|nr:hypothetical protein [Mucilaginibacter ginkgonis]QQL50106.1 hypothetical protein GO620_001240 [Mucilaginibacter ginkgonis]
MKFKLSLLLFPALILIVFITNSCKKTDQSYTPTLLTASPWTLASVEVHNYVGATENKVDTLNTKCLLKQIFTFSSDNTCNYQNFICRAGSNSGNWQFSDDKLTLMANFTAKDTVLGGRDTTDMPFKNARIANLGSYSLILETGDINTYYTSSTVRHIKRWAFIHQ